MKVISQYIVFDNVGIPQILFECEGGFWYITTNGAFGQREMALTTIAEPYAKELIENSKQFNL